MTKAMRKGDWFLTYTGKKFYPTDPRPEDVFIEDIAHSLANICRFGGHVIKFYSVAQHSIMVSDLCPKCPFQALLHDATESFCGDMVRPLKVQLPEYKAVENLLWAAICERFNIPVVMDPMVKHMDNVALMTERRDLLIKSDYPWSLEATCPPVPEKIIPLDPDDAELVFMSKFHALCNN